MGVGEPFLIISTKDDSVTQLMNYKGVCRVAPATPGLLNSSLKGIEIDILLTTYLCFFACILNFFLRGTTFTNKISAGAELRVHYKYGSHLVFLRSFQFLVILDRIYQNT